MRLPNGYGTVAKLSGRRRRPYIVKKTLGFNEKGHPIIEIVGYTATREEGLELLAQFNRDPWDVDRAKVTLQELFDLWKEKKAPKLGQSNRACNMLVTKKPEPLILQGFRLSYGYFTISARNFKCCCPGTLCRVFE